jgi:molecular chaperone DnaK
MSNDNVELGRFDLVGIPPAPRGVPQIEVTFDIDVNGIVHVHAKDKATGKEQSIQITSPKKLSEDEIQKMVKEAEKYAEEDTKRKEEAELQNQANTLVYSTEKALKDYGEKVPQEERDTIMKELETLKQAIKDKTADRIKTSMEALTKASHKLAEEMYKATSAQAGQPGADAAAAAAGAGAAPEQDAPQDHSKKDGHEGVIDADFKVKDDDKK